MPVLEAFTSPNALMTRTVMIAEIEFGGIVRGPQQMRIAVMVVLPTRAERRHHR